MDVDIQRFNSVGPTVETGLYGPRVRVRVSLASALYTKATDERYCSHGELSHQPSRDCLRHPNQSFTSSLVTRRGRRTLTQYTMARGKDVEEDEIVEEVPPNAEDDEEEGDEEEYEIEAILDAKHGAFSGVSIRTRHI